MKVYITFLMLVVAIVAIGFIIKITGQQASATDLQLNETALIKPSAQTQLKWHSSNELEKLQAQNPKQVIVDIYTDWCKWCKVMDEQTFTNKALIEYLNKHFYMVKFNAETKENIKFKNSTYSFVNSGRKGHNQLAQTLTNGQLAFPSFVVLNEQLNTKQVIRGFKTAEEFKRAIENEMGI